MPGTVLGAEDSVITKTDKNPCPGTTCILVGRYNKITISVTWLGRKNKTSKKNLSLSGKALEF